MDRNAVLTELYNSTELKRAMSNLVPLELQPDLKQELFLLLCELSDTDFKILVEGCFLKAYVIRTIQLMARSKRSSFAIKYRPFKALPEYDSVDLSEQQTEGYPVELVCDLVNNLHFYDRDIIKMYAEFDCNGAAVARKTNIEIRSVRKAITRATATVKQRLNEVYY